MFEILGETVARYPLDGVFFNMIGYQRSDYSGNYHGVCQCRSCQEKFREFSGMELPKTQDENSPAYRTYLEFTRMMSDRQFNRRLRVEASPLVEVTHRVCNNGPGEWVALFNHSGQQGKALHPPVAMSGIRIHLKPHRQVRSVRLLRGGSTSAFTPENDGRIAVVVPQLAHYEIVLFEYAAPESPAN